MTRSKKAIGFFVSLTFLTFGYFAFTTKEIQPFSDFALLEWQIKLALQGTFHLHYEYLLEDPNFQFFPLPDIFFHVHNGLPYSTFPNFYPILFSPIYACFGILGIKLAQLVLFFLSIYIFYLMNKDVSSTILLLFGSTISIYVFLIHETILFLFLEVLVLYLYHRRWTGFSGLLSMCLVWMRPEMIFAIGFLPLCFTKEHNWKRFVFIFFITGTLFSILNQITLGTFFPLRLVKNSGFQFRTDTSFYLFKIWAEQVPIFILFVLSFIRSMVRKVFSYQNLVLLLITIVMILISPNTGGHNTPRYLFGLIPLYILVLRKNEIAETQITKPWIFILFILSCYSLNTLFQQTKELRKISKYQMNTVQEITKIKDKVLVFNNSDFSFVVAPEFMSLPFSKSEKDILLLRPDYDNKTLIQILTTKHNQSFTFLELPPSPIPLRPNVAEIIFQSQIKYRISYRYQLPEVLLPIQATQCLLEVFYKP
ncbi:LA_3751/LA_3752 family putative glycosyltransferase [Leptospira perdikensis]|uniref:DUF2079 domain-containing protein n=1 Tax=Leptospira perdikensis TaxID=2484948 RepID=A0A4R9JFK2_9LEPT|nr:hypothetical protein [Leptospira perdikensis]TGL40313.1 hypothetical protein EHQ49_09640 [Leptospira perdikensis]